MSKDFDKAINELHAGNLAEAIYQFTKAIENDPLNADAYFYRGKALRQNGDMVGALNDFRKTLEINPNHNQAKVSIEMIQKILGFRNPDIYNA